METKSKQGGGIAIVVPPAVRAFIEGEDGEDSEERARTVVDTPRLPQDTQQLVGGTSSTLTQQIQSAPTPAQPDKPSTSSFGGGSALVNRDEINLTIRALAPTASLVEGQFGSSALIDKKPGDLRSADGIGPLYVIGATMNSTGAVSVRPQPKTRTATSFFSRIQTAFAALFKIGSDRAFAQETSQSGGALFPSYQTSLPVTKFDPGLSYVFTYSREDVVNVDEKTIRLYSWDVAEDAWIPERSAVDTQTRTVTAQLGHLSIFRLFGEALGIPASAKRNYRRPLRGHRDHRNGNHLRGFQSVGDHNPRANHDREEKVLHHPQYGTLDVYPGEDFQKTNQETYPLCRLGSLSVEVSETKRLFQRAHHHPACTRRAGCHSQDRLY